MPGSSSTTSTRNCFPDTPAPCSTTSTGHSLASPIYHSLPAERKHSRHAVVHSPARMKIAVAMSGGVDSSTAAYLLKSAGHEVVGLSMQMYDNLRNAETTYGGCCTIDDLADARP